MAKLTTEEFIKRAKEVHGDKYDYSLVEYVNSSTKVKIICPKHGIFEQIPYSHLKGFGCRLCGFDTTNNKQRRSNDEFIKKAIEKHGVKYDYSKVEYVNSNTKVIVVCLEHGEFLVTPSNHLRGKGCPKCAGRYKTTEEFVKQAKAVHGDRYDYSSTVYVDFKTKVRIICPEHGEFICKPANHINGTGCPYCNGGIPYTKEIFIEKSRTVHGDKYDYSKVDYVNSREKVCIICPTHGEFWQTPTDHLQGKGCFKCSVDKHAERDRFTKEEFINKVHEVHGDKYDYSKVEYINSQTPILIICQEHGEFWQTPNNHLRGKGCPGCNEKKLEREVRLYLTENNINFIPQYRDKEIFKKQSIDFYLPDLNIAIECQGIQHFQPTDFAGNGDEWSKEMYDYVVKLDKNKQYLCDKNNIKLIYFTTEANKSYITEEKNTHYKNYQLLTSLDDLLLSIRQQLI